MPKRFLCAMFCFLFLLCPLPAAAAQSEQTTDVLAIANGIIAWKKSDNGAPADGYLINDKYLLLAGTTPGDWYPIALGRLCIPDNNAAYLAVLKDQVEKRYREPGKLSAAKATEWHRISLAILAMGGDPTNFGTDANGEPINLIADGTYNRGRTTPLGRQGINGWIWGLITLDSLRYPVPDDAYYTRDDIIEEILCCQLSDGGFALSGEVSDPDITAMALQALAPYYDSDTLYRYTRKITGETEEKTVRQITEEALSCLSALQLPSGDFKSWGTQNVESTDQVVVALCCLGIDPLSDPRFIKDGNTLLDGILRYRMPDGGFVHSFTYDPDNPTSLPDRSNTMASEQTLYTMAALWRQQNGVRTLYDFRPEQNTAPEQAAFTEEDCRTVDALPQKLTTEQYVLVVTLADKLQKSPDFAQKEHYAAKLADAKAQIEQVQAQIDELNQTIEEKLYPFENISLRDKKTIDEIVERYKALSEYDREKILHYEDVVKSKTKVDNALRAILIAIGLTLFCVLLALILVHRIKKRRHRRENELAALAAQYQDEDDD